MNRLIEQLQQLQEKKWKKWVETVEDEETHKMVDVEHKELLTTETSDEERQVWQQIIPELPKLSDNELNQLEYHILPTTDIDTTPIIEVRAQRGDVFAMSMIGDIASLQTLCEQGNKEAAEEMAYKYAYGNEENGIYIDHKKAAEYMKLAGKDYNPKDYEEEDYPSEHDYTLQGNASDITCVRTMIDMLCQKYGTPDNELGLYVPLGAVMRLLVGSAAYRGNIISMEQPSSDCLTIHTEANNAYPLLYALRQCFPNLEIEIQE